MMQMGPIGCDTMEYVSNRGLTGEADQAHGGEAMYSV